MRHLVKKKKKNVLQGTQMTKKQQCRDPFHLVEIVRNSSKKLKHPGSSAMKNERKLFV